MNKASHNRKKHLARKLMTPGAWRIHRPIFSSFVWMERSEAIAARVKRNVEKSKARKVQRLLALERQGL
jgi:hypothetical protein